MNNISSLIDEYYKWLRDETSIKEAGEGFVEITAPYLDRNNDYIQIYLKKKGEQYILTDGGATIDSLEQEGCLLSGKSRKDLLKLILNGYGVKEEKGRLEIITKEHNFALRKHSLLQAMLSINDMFYLAKPYVKNLFFDDVRNWLDDSEIRYSENIPFIGVSHYARRFDFLIPKSKNAPERMIQLINNPTKNNADTVIMDWVDTKETRHSDAIAYALINDEENKIPQNVKEALESYDIQALEWKNRENYKEKLAA